jgi:enamine deaminase RidA (YjgF/YER057c/UK114 family)
MMLQRLNPEGLFQPSAYTQVVVATGSRIVFLAGQVAVDASGQVVSDGDFAGQAQAVFQNLSLALAAAGATAADVTKLTIYVVHYSPDQLTVIGDMRRALFGDRLPASTLVGVEALARPEYLLEVEATAVLD